MRKPKSKPVLSPAQRGVITKIVKRELTLGLARIDAAVRRVTEVDTHIAKLSERIDRLENPGIDPRIGVGIFPRTAKEARSILKASKRHGREAREEQPSKRLSRVGNRWQLM